jgi:hypothetical protein
MTGNSLRPWRAGTARAGRGRAALGPLAAGLAALIICPALGGVAGAAPRPGQGTAQAANFLSGVSCPSATACWAAGEHSRPAGPSVPAIERLSHGAWTAVPAPEPAGAAGAQLTGVSCPSTAGCMAVGTYQAPSGASLPFADRWNGTGWSLAAMPAAGSANAGPDGVTCTSTRNCWAVGWAEHGSRTKTLAERWDGTAWLAVSAPSVSGSSRLNSVSCAHSTDCWAAGFWESSAPPGFGTLTLHWDGTAWSKVTTPTSGFSSSQLWGSSCSGPGACLTVGSGTQGGLAQRWDGTAWSVSLRNGGSNPGSGLFGAACASGAVCMAVGSRATTPDRGVTLADQWNGTRWSPLVTPSRANWPENTLTGVACPSAANCWAVGGSLNQGAPGKQLSIIEHWNGAKWSLAG